MQSLGPDEMFRTNGVYVLRSTNQKSASKGQRIHILPETREFLYTNRVSVLSRLLSMGDDTHKVKYTGRHMVRGWVDNSIELKANNKARRHQGRYGCVPSVQYWPVQPALHLHLSLDTQRDPFAHRLEQRSVEVSRSTRKGKKQPAIL